jgi:hypothetical protein
MDPFEEDTYYHDYIEPRLGASSLPNPDNLLKRYAITLPAADQEIVERLKTVRAYWDRISKDKSLGKGKTKKVVQLCQRDDWKHRDKHDKEMSTSAWWEEQRRASADSATSELSEELKKTYGDLGVVTLAAVHGVASSLGLEAFDIDRDAKRVAAEAKLEFVDVVPIPQNEPIKKFKVLEDKLRACGAQSVPDLIHPGLKPFTLLSAFTCAGDSEQDIKQLNSRAIEAQIDLTNKAKREESTERGEALKLLRTEVKDRGDEILREIALFDLIEPVASLVAKSLKRAKEQLVDSGLDEREAGILTVLLADQQRGGNHADLGKVRKLLSDGRLREAREAAQLVTGDSTSKTQAVEEVTAKEDELAKLLAEVKVTQDSQQEAVAEELLEKVSAISQQAADDARAILPPAPPVNLRVTVDGEQITLNWQPAAGHSHEASYTVVARTDQRWAEHPQDGKFVPSSRELYHVDPHPAVARTIRYGVFASIGDRPPSRPATVETVVLPPVSHLGAELGSNEVTLHWSAHPGADEVRVTRNSTGSAPQPVQVTGNSCDAGGLAEGLTQHFEVTAVYHGLHGEELRSSPAQINATPRSEAKPLEKLRARPVEVAGAARLRVAWTPVDHSEIRIHHAPEPSPWTFGSWVTEQQMAQWGSELSGHRERKDAEEIIEAEVAPGVHHLVPFSIGGTGIVVGQSRAVGVADPVRHLVVTPFADYATVSWEWPPSAQLAEVSWKINGETDSALVKLPQYRAEGGAHVPLGGGPCTVEVRAVVMAEGKSFVSPPVTERIDRVVEAEVRYTVSSAPSVGPFGGRSKKITFVSDAGCQDVRVRVLSAAGRVMPTSAEAGCVLLDTALNLQPGAPVVHEVEVPKAVKKPRWVRCFVVGGRAQLVDPPLTTLKET